MSWIPPRLKTNRLELIALGGGDPVPFSHEIYNEELLPGLPSNWTIFLKGSDEAIGSIGYIRWERDKALGEIGFILKHTERKRGYMTEACHAVIHFGFCFMVLQIVEGRSLPNNQASVRLLEKVGMKKQGCVQTRLSSKCPLLDLDVYHIDRGLFPLEQGLCGND